MTQTISIPLVTLAIASSFGEGWFAFHHENVLGTSLELKVLAPTPAAADRAEAIVLAEIDREAKILSGYDPGSEFSRWFKTRGEIVPVSDELFEVLSRFDRYRTLTGGALDPAAQTITQVWKSAEASHRLPSQAEMEAAVAAARGPHWSLDPVRHTVTHTSDAPLILNSFAKSYIAGRAADAALAGAPVTAVVLNIGGDLIVRGPRTELVNIADPRNDAENAEPIARIQVRDRAVATSGNYRRGFQIGGQFYSHIVDPRTGRPADHILSSTVVAQDPSNAGALATAFSVLKPEESARVAQAVPGVEYLLILRDGSRVTSPGWMKLAARAASPAEPSPAEPPPVQPEPQEGAGQWDPQNELTIAFELARIAGGHARRPFVAVWIEDQDGFPVRTISLWGLKPRWIPELRAWQHDDAVRNAVQHHDITASVSSATRPPGKYTLKWDGKDNSGRLVKPGAYTVNIEAAREHGTHQILRQEMEFKGAPQHIELQGGTEISAASLDYGKKEH
jgi:thiamine biosynthesis lipoprotein ApbE